MKCQIVNCNREITPENTYLVTEKYRVQKKDSFQENVFTHMVCKKCANALINAVASHITITYLEVEEILKEKEKQNDSNTKKILKK